MSNQTREATLEVHRDVFDALAWLIKHGNGSLEVTIRDNQIICIDQKPIYRMKPLTKE